MRQCTQITDGIVSRKAHKSGTSTWFSPGNYSQCLFPHRTVSQLNSDWSHFWASREPGRKGDKFVMPLRLVSGVNGTQVSEGRLPTSSWNKTSFWP